MMIVSKLVLFFNLGWRLYILLFFIAFQFEQLVSIHQIFDPRESRRRHDP